MSFASMLGGLVDKKVKFVVVGGVAATAHGSSRVTNDLDICYDTDVANIIALASLLSAWKAYPRGVEAGLPFIMDDRTLRGAPILTLTSTEGDIDVMDLVAGVGSYELARKHSEKVDALGVSFRVLDLPSLIKAKRAAGRPRDFDHLPELEALLALRRRSAITRRRSQSE
jgi:predicted nucleotidyltransferase